MNKTKIPWADYTWNPITGCSAISEGCKNCYAEAVSKRFGWKWGEPQFHPERLDEPGKVKKSSKIFVCSMSDLFHGSNKPEWIRRILCEIIDNPQHTFIILTKRPRIMKEFFLKNSWFDGVKNQSVPINNLWLGVTVENQKRVNERIPVLCYIPAKVRFVSAEPLLEDINLNLCHECQANPEECREHNKINWVIAGGETGPSARYCDPDWIMRIKENVPENRFFFKQWGTNKETKKKTGLINRVSLYRERMEETENERNFPEV